MERTTLETNLVSKSKSCKLLNFLEPHVIHQQNNMLFTHLIELCENEMWKWMRCMHMYGTTQ